MKILLFQGIYYLITGLWPIFHISSFMAVSGPKTDIWLVKTVGVLTTVIAVVLLLHYFSSKKQVSREITFLAMGSAVGYTIIDVYYAIIDRIWDVYLIDAAVQVLLLVVWLTYVGRKSAIIHGSGTRS